MNRDPVEPDRSTPPGHVQVTGPGPLVILGLIALVIGWGLRWQAIHSGSTSPTVSWLAVSVTWFIAATTLGIAYLTRKALAARPRSLTPQQAVNRLVLGKSIDRLAAFGLGIYLGIAISRIGAASESAGQVMFQALLAALGAGIAVAAGLLLEHACRVPGNPDADLP